jgi:hypothetical protein
VSALAAGCAICGHDLEAHRAEQQARRDRPLGALALVMLFVPQVRFGIWQLLD